MTFDEWKRERARERESLRVSILAHLEGGGIVREVMGRYQGLWPDYIGGIIPEVLSDLEWVADHLVNRHYGFGSRLSFL